MCVGNCSAMCEYVLHMCTLLVCMDTVFMYTYHMQYVEVWWIKSIHGILSMH